jgi:predicted DNA-binding transcriptional regulator YafY
MSKRESILRYNLIINKLRRKPASFKEIYHYLDEQGRMEEYNLTISERTFIRDRDDIRAIYKIDIQYDPSQKVYYIEYDENSEVHNRLLEAFDTLNVFNLSSNLSSAVHFEKRRPAGTENLYGMVHAIKNNLVVKFDYHKFYEETSTQRIVHAIALKEYKHRWYLMAIEEDNDVVKSFGLDRISKLEISNQKASLKSDVDIEEKYKHSFGIICNDGQEPEEVVISFTPFQGQYIKSMPLHHSQEVLKDNDQECKIKLNIHITHDFIMEIQSMSDRLKVVEPAWLRDELRERLERAVSNCK